MGLVYFHNTRYANARVVMDYSVQFQKLCQIEKGRWLFVVGLVALTHLLCQSLMLPYQTAFLSMLPSDKPLTHGKESFLSRQSSVNSVAVSNSVFARTDEKVGIYNGKIVHENGPMRKVDSLQGGFTSDGEGLVDSYDHLEDEVTMHNILNADKSAVSETMMSPKIPPFDEGSSITSEALNRSSEGKQIKLHLKDENQGLMQRNLTNLNNISALVDRPVRKKMRCEMPPRTVTSIYEMNRLFVRRHASSRGTRPRWSSVRDQDILAARLEIQSASIAKNDRELYSPIFRNVSMFTRSYELMERMLKVYVYKDGGKPIFHQPILKGLYASEGWFMKLMEGNKQFTVKDPQKAHLYYMPFSSRMLEFSLYVPNSHNRTNLRQFLKSYSEKIAAKYPFWNRTGGADHFLVACHDWAPYETRHHMESCIKALCNADVTMGYKIGRDVSLPTTYVRAARNPQKDIGGKPPSERHILAFYAGNMHGYLRPILLKYWKDKDPDMKIFGPMPPGVASKMNYIQHMKSSKYCICPKGYGVNSPRVVEAIFYECVPVIISDNFVPPFFEVLNWEAFSLILAEKDVPSLKDILLSIPDEKYRRMQLGVRKLQRHFLWHAKPVKYDLFHMTLHAIWYNRVFQAKPR